MRQSPRLMQGSSSRAGRSNGPQPTIADTLPHTPHHPRNGAALDNLILSLENEWHLGLKLRDSHWSPQKTDEKCISDKVYGQIKRLHYGAKPTLNSVLENFQDIAPGFAHDERLKLLNGLLKSKTRSPISRTGTPLNEPPKSLGSAQPSLGQSSRPARLFDAYRRDDPESYDASIDDPGSPTDVDDDDYYTPPSPTRSPVSARRHAGEGVSSRASSSSPKLTKTLRGKQPVDVSAAVLVQQPLYPDLFKVPSLSMARSFQGHGNYNAPSSASTSFNKDDSVFSSQQTQATSANTSFMTDGANNDATDQRARKSSISLESLAEAEAIAAVKEAERKAFELEKSRESDRIFSQEASRESNSTYGSVDEDIFLDITSRAEAESKATLATDSSVTGLAQPSPPAPACAPPAQSNKSPSRVAWYIRDLPQSNLFVDELPSSLTNCPYFLLFIGCRIAVANGVSLSDVLSNVNFSPAQTSPNLFWSKLAGHLQSSPRDSDAVWPAARRSFEGYTFKGNVVFETPRAGSLFKLNLLPIEAENSCLLQRMFGSDRFLYLTFPSLQEDKMPQIEAHWKMWASKVHSFLGRKWRVFHVEQMSKKAQGRKSGENPAATRVILFATHGVGIDSPMSVGEMLNEFLPFAENGEQNFCKVYARLDLALSRSTPTFTFKPSQIRRIPDLLADLTPEAREFDDQNLDWSEKPKERPIMNDGCAQISVGAALKLWQCYRDATGSDEPLPSAFQGRIGGAKGMWMLSAEPHTRDPAHLAIWIDVTDSQEKFTRAHADLADNRPYNPHRLTFNHVNHTFVHGARDLHISFIPILVDRGVSRDVIAGLMRNRLDQDREQLMDMLDDPVRLHNWITKQGSATPPQGILPWQAALPLAVAERVKLLLRTGFSPRQSPFLAHALKGFVKQRQRWMEEKLRAPLGKATFLWGLADPLGVLKPGEVHIQFSSPFLDEYDRSTYRHLAGEELLVARQPACRRSDIQKMRAVSHPRLSHLVDVIVFPTRGEYPAAGKLQGGDYDGDTFWICWEAALVAPFLNAPAPVNALDPRKYDIVKDTRKLNQVMNPRDLSTVEKFLEEALAFRMEPSMLGKATLFLEKVAYHKNCIHSDTLSLLYGLHDLLVDAAKQAYHFNNEDWTKFKQRNGYGHLSKPAYKAAMDANKSKATGEDDKRKEDSAQPNSDNVLDFLYFYVLRKHNEDTLKALEIALPKEEDDDPDLQAPFLQLQAKADDAMKYELESLLAGIAKIMQHWNSNLSNKTERLHPEKYNKLINTCYNNFRSLMPTFENAAHPEIAPLLFSYLGPQHPTIWETIRASALYTKYPKRRVFVWKMAGRELARLKAGTDTNTYSVVPGVFADLKTKPSKTVKPENGDNESEDDFESDIE
ncbi:RNA dependent RNA polymerase-domain-containing protein [Ampelomyces quisqualis]|uniref:RNA-dependent RNA polymerase n=1 Tax=Ampelomyces quisqualis TaxID=50730 RepID=A0A6A5QGX5_AMPQU|nr:RNA dependent RNA polymerase-domain-containing protein [Ampelomyces quisqualis]